MIPASTRPANRPDWLPGRPEHQRLARRSLAQLATRGSLPASYSAPVQVWAFGDELTMVFLPGEVVVDYALRLRRELAAK